MARSSAGACVLAALLCLLTPALGHWHSTSHQTSTLSAYEITIPQQLSEREKRDVGLNSSSQGRLSYVIQIAGRDHIIHLTKNDDFQWPINLLNHVLLDWSPVEKVQTQQWRIG